MVTKHLAQLIKWLLVQVRSVASLRDDYSSSRGSPLRDAPLRISLQSALQFCDGMAMNLTRSIGSVPDPCVPVRQPGLRFQTAQRTVTDEFLTPMQRFYERDWLPLLVPQGSQADSACHELMQRDDTCGYFPFDLWVRAKMLKRQGDEWQLTKTLLQEQHALVDQACSAFERAVVQKYLSAWELTLQLYGTGHGKQAQHKFVCHGECKHQCRQLGRALIKWRIYAHAANIYWKKRNRQVPLRWFHGW